MDVRTPRQADVKSEIGSIQKLRRQEGVGGQSNVYAHMVNDFFLFTLIVYKEWVGDQKSLKICLRSH